MKVIIVLEAPIGSNIEILDWPGDLVKPTRTGRFYEIVPHCPIIGSVTAKRQSDGLKVQVAPQAFCRVVTDEEIGAAVAK